MRVRFSDNEMSRRPACSPNAGAPSRSACIEVGQRQSNYSYNVIAITLQ